MTETEEHKDPERARILNQAVHLVAKRRFSELLEDPRYDGALERLVHAKEREICGFNDDPELADGLADASPGDVIDYVTHGVPGLTGMMRNRLRARVHGIQQAFSKKYLKEGMKPLLEIGKPVILHQYAAMREMAKLVSRVEMHGTLREIYLSNALTHDLKEDTDLPLEIIQGTLRFKDVGKAIRTAILESERVHLDYITRKGVNFYVEDIRRARTSPTLHPMHKYMVLSTKNGADRPVNQRTVDVFHKGAKLAKELWAKGIWAADYGGKDVLRENAVAVIPAFQGMIEPEAVADILKRSVWRSLGQMHRATNRYREKTRAEIVSLTHDEEEGERIQRWARSEVTQYLHDRPERFETLGQPRQEESYQPGRDIDTTVSDTIALLIPTLRQVVKAYHNLPRQDQAAAARGPRGSGLSNQGERFRKDEGLSKAEALYAKHIYESLGLYPWLRTTHNRAWYNLAAEIDGRRAVLERNLTLDASLRVRFAETWRLALCRMILDEDYSLFRGNV